MSFSIGIVGLPNVGKSTLFNALTKNAAEASNYPFCTIDPNVGVVKVPDTRLDQLAKTCESAKIIPTVIEFVDIAGLVKGASKGEGLGNQFLSHIREVDAIAQVVRKFENDDIKHVHDKIDPEDDIEIINTELAFADLQTIDKRLEKAETDSKSGDKEPMLQASGLKKYKDALENGKLASEIELTDEEKKVLADLQLITNKPMFYVLNVGEGSPPPSPLLSKEGVIPVSAKIEAELAELDDADREEFMRELDMKQSGLETVISAGYKVLDLITFFTAGEKETRAWTCKQGTLAPQAAGVIHTDFEKGFIKAEVVDWQEFVKYKGDTGAKEAGKLRLEGKEYMVRDGDVVHFRFNP